MKLMCYKFHLLFLINFFICYSTNAQTLDIVDCPGVSGGRCIERSLPNLVRMFNMNSVQFEKELKLVGVQIKYGNDFSIQGYEQLAWTGDVSRRDALIYSKHDSYLRIMWLGGAEHSGLIMFKNLLESLYLKTINGVRGYGFELDGKKYLITLDRKTADTPGVMTETLQIQFLE